MKKKQYALVGCCGMSCVLCPRFHSQHSLSRCPGCGLGSNRESCGTYKCCTENHNYETCAECAVAPCERLFLQADWVGFNTRKKWLDNLSLIKQNGIEQWFAEQLEKQALLEEALRYFHNNRMRSFFCLSFLYFQIDTIKKLVTAAQAQKNEEFQKRAASFEEAVKTEAIQHNLKIWDK